MKKAMRLLSMGANVAAIIGMLTGIYAFIYPASMSDVLEKIQQVLEGSAEDISKTQINTAKTEANTAKIADAIPNWIRFEHGPYKAGNPLSGLHTIASIVNDSPHPIELNIKSYGDGSLGGDEQMFIMPGEMIGHVTMGWFDKVSYCIEGISQGFNNEKFYEYRLYFEDRVTESKMGFEGIAEC